MVEIKTEIYRLVNVWMVTFRLDLEGRLYTNGEESGIVYL